LKDASRSPELNAHRSNHLAAGSLRPLFYPFYSPSSPGLRFPTGPLLVHGRLPIGQSLPQVIPSQPTLPFSLRLAKLSEVRPCLSHRFHLYPTPSPFLHLRLESVCCSYRPGRSEKLPLPSYCPLFFMSIGRPSGVVYIFVSAPNLPQAIGTPVLFKPFFFPQLWLHVPPSPPSLDPKPPVGPHDYSPFFVISCRQRVPDVPALGPYPVNPCPGIMRTHWPSALLFDVPLQNFQPDPFQIF